MADQITQQQERAKLIDDWARYTAERLLRSMLKKNVGSSGTLQASMLYMLKGVAGGDVSSVVHQFKYYGKFVDMGVGRGQKLGDVKGNADLYAIKGSGRRPKKWFSPTYYAEVMELESLLLNKYGEQSTAMIKETIQGIYQ
jgi:hypothetical protein